MKSVCIGIQARSTSERFPRKIFAKLGNKTILQHVVYNAQKSSGHLNATSKKSGFMVHVVLLCPYDDPAKDHVKIPVIEGDEHDVLSRYVTMAKKFDADYIVRITADCPLLPPPLITAHINKCVKNDLDYLSNVDEDYRLAIDGHDCEIMSRRVLEWLDENSRDREHVTTLIRQNPPAWAKVGHIVGFVDLSWIKLSIDTPEDLELIKKQYEKITNSLRGHHEKHRF